MSRRSRQLAIAFALVTASGCDVVFDLNRPPPPGLENYDRCGAFLYADPLRYAQITAPDALPWSWDAARTDCQLRGMDLAVFNDEHELGMAAPGWPYWIGQQTIGTAVTTVDGCPAITAPVATRLVAADATACGVVAGSLEIDGASCDGQLPATMEPSIVSTALCETPRPDSAACLGNDPALVQYVMSDAPMTHAKASQFCAARDGHLVVVETFAEWKFVTSKTSSTWQHDFWVGSQLHGTTWQTDTGCPATYSWTHGAPGAPPDGSCLATKTREIDDPDPGLSGIVVEGVEATACDDAASYALCELD